MKFTSAIILVSAAISSAQVTSNPDGSFTCAIPDAAYCAGDSLGTNIIIRCIGTVGHPGNCNDNLSGEFPQGVSFAPCFQTSKTSGDAACAKNCVVYEGSGSGKQNGTLTLPSCTPQTPPPTSTVILPYSVNTTTATYIQASTFYTTTPPTTTSTPSVGPISTGTGIIGTGTPGCTGNCSLPTGGSGGSGSGSLTIPTNSATATPKSPSSPASVSFSSGATTNSGGALAIVGIIFAYFL